MRHKLSILSFLLVCSCTGPWNTQPGGTVTLPRLLVSNLVVAGRPYDTLWLTRSLPLDGTTYDSTRRFVDTAASWIRVIRLDGAGAPDTVDYHLGSPMAIAWLPGKKDDRAVLGSTYRLEAHIRWDAAPEWGSSVAPEWKLADLQATTYTPKVFSQGPLVQAPMEALFPSLASGGYSSFASFASGTSKAVQDSLARWNVTSATLDSLSRGIPVYRPIRSGDTVWYIRSEDPVTVLDGNPGVRFNRSYLVPQTLDRQVFGGILSIQRFDSTRAWILSPTTQAMNTSRAKVTIDSTREYQSGQWRFVSYLNAYQGSLVGWPDQLQIENRAIGYTGLNVFYSYVVDTLYSAHVRGLSNANNVLPYTNIHGGYGYFTGAAVDSVSLFVKSATKDTVPVSALRGAWCRRRRSRMQDSLYRAGADTVVDTFWIRNRAPQCSDMP